MKDWTCDDGELPIPARCRTSNSAVVTDNRDGIGCLHDMKSHFVTFESPGTFFHERTEKPIDSWDIDKASEMAHGIVERHNSTPFAFFFTTRERKEDELDSREIAQSGRYFLGGDVLNLKQVKGLKDSDYSILISNMECNGWSKVVMNKNSWTVFQPLMDKDTVLNWKPNTKSTKAA